MYSLYSNTNLITVDLKNYVRLAVLVHNFITEKFEPLALLVNSVVFLLRLPHYDLERRGIIASTQAHFHPQYHVIVEGNRERGRSARVGPLACKVL
jgi:hypothetical protein